MTKPTWRRSRTCLTKAALEREPGGAHADHVAVHERRLAHALAVHLGAVGRSEVDERVPLAEPADLGVATGDVRIVEHDVAAARAPDHGRRPFEPDVASVPHEHGMLAGR